MNGHFEKGAWIPPTCKRCGKCCEFLWFRCKPEDPDYEKFELLHEGVWKVGEVLWCMVPCRYLTLSYNSAPWRTPRVASCSVHGTDEQPDCCKRFGTGDYYHPPGCAFE